MVSHIEYNLEQKHPWWSLPLLVEFEEVGLEKHIYFSKMCKEFINIHSYNSSFHSSLQCRMFVTETSWMDGEGIYL